MSAETLEHRVTHLEVEMAQLKCQVLRTHELSSAHPWEKLVGSMADSEGFQEAVKLGDQYRESLRPNTTKESS